MKQDIIKTLKIVTLALVITLGVNYIYAWTGPTATPPSNNTATPINAGPVDQVKSPGTGTGNNGGLSLGVLTVQGKSLFNTIQITGGAPVDGYVLTATDASGNATWEEPSQTSTTPPAGLVLGGYYFIRTSPTYTNKSCQSEWGTSSGCTCTDGVPRLSGFSGGYGGSNQYNSYLCISE